MAFFSLEMNRVQMNSRLVIFDAHVNPLRLGADQQHIAKDALDKYRDIGLYINDRPQTLASLLPAIRRHITSGCKIIFIDYLGLVRNTGKENLNQHLGQVMQSLKGLAMEYRVDIIIGAQLNRLSRKEKRAPELWDLRDSGNIEQDADLVIFIDRADWRDPDEPAEIDVKANRHGETGSFTVGWDPQSKVFTNMDTYE